MKAVNFITVGVVLTTAVSVDAQYPYWPMPAQHVGAPFHYHPWAAQSPRMVTPPMPAAIPVRPVAMPAMPVAHAPQQAIPGAHVPEATYCEEPCVDCWSDCPRPPCYWSSIDYLYWWIKPQPLPILLTGDDAPISIFDFTNAANRPIFEQYPVGRVVLVGDDQDYNGFSGSRITVGMWLDDTSVWGVEVSGFVLEDRTRFFSITTNGFGIDTAPPNRDGFGRPYLAIPYIVGNPGVTGIGPSGLPFTSFGSEAANDNAIDGVFNFSTSSKLWGIEGNAIYNLARYPSASWELLGGLRFLHLAENVTYTVVEQDGSERDTIASDFFGGTTDFYGFQVGTRFSAEGERWSYNLAAKVAVGANLREVRIRGNSVQTNLVVGNVGVVGPGRGPFPYGVFALPSNTGSHHTARVSVVPEVEMKIGYRLTPRLRATLGYNFLYWLNVVRPGDQIDNVVLSTNYNDVGGAPEGLDLHIRNEGPGSGRQGVAVGAVGRPGVLSRQSDFWAHGVSAGLECSW